MTQIVQARPMAARLDSQADLVGSFPKYSIQARRMDPTPSPRGEDVGNRTVAVFCEVFSLTPFVVGERDTVERCNGTKRVFANLVSWTVMNPAAQSR